MFKSFLKSFISCCLVVGLMPRFSCLYTTKAFAQANESIYDIIFGESSDPDGFYAENDNDQLLGANDRLPNDDNQPQSEDELNQPQDVVLDELSQQSFALDSKPNDASDENGASDATYASSNENPDLKPQNSKENTTLDESDNSVENSENGFNYVDYKIKVTTQDIRYAGFDGLVQIRVNGEYGSTGFHTLDKSRHNDFERGDSDDYSFRDRSVGVVNSVTLNTDSENSWFLQDIILTVENQTYYLWANSNWINGTVDIPVTQQRRYFLEYTTPNYSNAGSDDKYYICLVGNNGYTGYYSLGDPTKGKTEKTSFTSKDVGELKYAVIGSGQDVSLNNAALDSTIDSSIALAIQIVTTLIMNAISKAIAEKQQLKEELKKEGNKKSIKEAYEEELAKKAKVSNSDSTGNTTKIDDSKTSIINGDQSGSNGAMREDAIDGLSNGLDGNIDDATTNRIKSVKKSEEAVDNATTTTNTNRPNGMSELDAEMGGNNNVFLNENQINEANSKVNDYSNEVDQLKKQLDDFDNNIKKVDGEMADIQKQIEVTKKVDEMQRNITKIENEINVSKESVLESENQLKNIRTEMANCKKNIKEIRDEIYKLNSENSKYLCDLNEYNSKIAERLNKDIKTKSLYNDFSGLSEDKKLNCLNKIMQEHRDLIEKVETSETAINNKFNGLDYTLNSLKNNNNDILNELNAYKEFINSSETTPVELKYVDFMQKNINEIETIDLNMLNKSFTDKVGYTELESRLNKVNIHSNNDYNRLNNLKKDVNKIKSINNLNDFEVEFENLNSSIDACSSGFKSIQQYEIENKNPLKKELLKGASSYNKKMRARAEIGEKIKQCNQDIYDINHNRLKYNEGRERGLNKFFNKSDSIYDMGPKEALKTKNAEIKNLHEKFTSLSTEIEEIQKNTAIALGQYKYDLQVRLMNSDFDRMVISKKVDVLKQTFSEYLSQLNTLKDQSTTRFKNIDFTISQIKELESKINKLSSDTLFGLTSKELEHTQNIFKTNDEITTLRNSLATKSDELYKFKLKNVNMFNNDTTLDALRTNLDLKNLDYKDLMFRRDNLEKQLKLKNSLIEKQMSTAKANSLSKGISELDTEMGGNNNFTLKENQISESRPTIDYSKEVDKLKNELRGVDNKINNAKVEIKDIEDQIDVKKNIEKTQKNISEIKNKIDLSNEYVTNLKNELGNIQSEILNRQTDIDKINAEINNLHSNNSNQCFFLSENNSKIVKRLNEDFKIESFDCSEFSGLSAEKKLNCLNNIKQEGLDLIERVKSGENTINDGFKNADDLLKRLEKNQKNLNLKGQKLIKEIDNAVVKGFPADSPVSVSDISSHYIENIIQSPADSPVPASVTDGPDFAKYKDFMLGKIDNIEKIDIKPDDLLFVQTEYSIDFNRRNGDNSLLSYLKKDVDKIRSIDNFKNFNDECTKLQTTINSFCSEYDSIIAGQNNAYKSFQQKIFTYINDYKIEMAKNKEMLQLINQTKDKLNTPKVSNLNTSKNSTDYLNTFLNDSIGKYNASLRRLDDIKSNAFCDLIKFKHEFYARQFDFNFKCMVISKKVNVLKQTFSDYLPDLKILTGHSSLYINEINQSIKRINELDANINKLKLPDWISMGSERSKKISEVEKDIAIFRKDLDTNFANLNDLNSQNPRAIKNPKSIDVLSSDLVIKKDNYNKLLNYKNKLNDQIEINKCFIKIKQYEGFDKHDISAKRANVVNVNTDSVSKINFPDDLTLGKVKESLMCVDDKPFNPNCKEDLSEFYCFDSWDKSKVDKLKYDANKKLKFPSLIKTEGRPFEAMSTYVDDKLNKLEISKINAAKEDLKLIEHDIDMFKSRKFHKIAGSLVWKNNSELSLEEVLSAARTLYDMCVVEYIHVSLPFAGAVGSIVDLASFACDLKNNFFKENVSFIDTVNNNPNDSEEARFLKGVCILNQGLNYENSSQELSDKYLSYVNDFNTMFRDFCMNTESIKQISTQTIAYLIELISDLNTFESEYLQNGFNSNELTDLYNMLFYVYYCRAGLDSFDNLGSTENNTDDNNESEIAIDNSANYLRITKQPSKLSYNMLEPLEIEDVVLTLKTAGKDPVEISYDDLNEYGITSNHYSGWALSLEDKTLDFSYSKDNINLSASLPINVEIPEEVNNLISGQNAFDSMDSILQCLRYIYSSQIGNEDKIAEDVKRSTLNILNAGNGVTGTKAFGLVMNLWDTLTFFAGFPFPILALIAVPTKLIVSGIIAAVTYTDCWYVDSIKVYSPGHADCVFWCRDWVYAENPEIVPADNVPYDVEIKTSSDSGAGYGGEVYIQFVSESPESANGKTQDGSRLLSKTHKLIGEDFDAGSSNKYYVADKNIGDISKIKLFTKSDNEWKLESLNLVVNGKKYICKCGDWVNGNIELVPEKNASEAVYDVKVKTFNSADAVNAKDIKNALQIQFNGENNNLYSSNESISFKKSNKIEDCFEVQDIFTNNVTKLQSVVITNTKDCKLPIDYLIINNQKYYVRQVISKDQSVVIDPSDKKSAYDVKFKISDIKNFDCKGKLKSNFFVKISGKDPNYKDVEINDELPLTLSDKDINSLTSGSEVKFYLVSSVNIKYVEKVEIIRKNDTNAPSLPLDYVEVVSNCIDKWGGAVEMPEKHFYCGKYFRDSIVLSASDKVYKFDFKNLKGNQLQSLTAYSMSLGGKIDAGNTAANSDTVNSEPFFPALDYNSNKSQEIIIGDSCKIDKLLCLDFTSESSEPNKKWGLDYVTYNGIKANVNSSFSNEESKFRIDFTNRYCVTFHTKDRNIKSHLNFSIIGENKNVTKEQDLAYFKGDVAAFEDENNIDKIYGIKLNSDSEIFLDSVEVNAPCGSHTFICRRSFKGNLTLSVEDQVLDIEIKTGDVENAETSTNVFIQLVKKADKGSNEKDVFSKKLEFEESLDNRKQIHSKVFVLLESKKETVKDFNMIKIKRGYYRFKNWFMDSIVINGTTYYYRNWINSGQEITINTSSPKTAYNVDVKTSDFYEAGTNCDVSIILENSNGDKSDDISLELEYLDEMEQGEENHYFIASDFGSKVDKCIVKVSDPGAWAFDYIKITQLDDVGKEKDSHTFYFGRWAHRSETVLSREDKIYTISAKEMDSSMINASENHSGDAYDITLIDNENKDKPKKSEEFRILRQCSEHKYASLMHDPKEEPIQNVSCVDVRFIPDESFMSKLGKLNMGLRPVDAGQNDAHLDYIKVNDKTFFCRKTLQANKERTFDWNITKTFGLGCEDLSRTTLYPGYHPYDVCVYTGDRDSAGTNDDIYIKLYGSNSKSESVSTEFMRLDTPDFDDFEQGDFTQYSLLDKTELNTITKVEVKKKGGGNNDWGGGGNNDWGLDYLTVKLFNGIIYTFDYFDWVRDDNVFIYPNGSINVKPYNVTVTTANNFGAGTDSDIYIKIIGVDAQNNTIKTARHLLDKPNYNDFEKGDVDTYSFMDTADIVDIKAINLENAVSDCCKVGGEWQVGNVNVDYNNHCYAFDCNNTKLGTGKNNNFDLTKKDDNVKSYAVRVKTADKLWAGTNSDIYITVYGKDGYQTKEHKLSKRYYDDFERNDFDTYYFLDSTDIKDVEKITLRNGTVGFGADWCVDYVKLIHSGCDYEFFCNNCWIEGNKTEDFRPSNMGRSDNNMESFRIVTKIKSDENCGSLSDILVKITGEKDSTGYKQSTNWRSKRGRCYAFSFNDKNVGDTVKCVEFYKIGGFSSDMIGIDTIYVYYKNRWYKAYFNVNCDLNGKSFQADAEVIGVVPSR